MFVSFLNSFLSAHSLLGGEQKETAKSKNSDGKVLAGHCWRNGCNSETKENTGSCCWLCKLLWKGNINNKEHVKRITVMNLLNGSGSMSLCITN